MTMHRLSGFDQAFLLLEGPLQPMHQCSLAELDVSAIPGGYSFEAIRNKLSVRALALPEFRAKLADSPLNFGTPVWVDDPDFTIDRHVHRIELSAPGSRRELCDVAERLAAKPMDRSRPLWDMWVIEGISGTDPRVSGRIAVVIRTHHVFSDGVSSGNLWAQLYAESDAPPPEFVDGFGRVSKQQIALHGLVQVVRRPWLLVVKALPASITGLIKTVRRALRGDVMSSPFATPPTPFNGFVSEHRKVAYVQLDLKDVKAVKNKFGVKVNDVMLALAAGAMRRFLVSRATLPDAAMIAIVPVSIYDETRPSRNQFTAVFTSLHTDIADPTERLRAIAEASSVAKDHGLAIGSTLPADWTQCAPVLFKAATRLYWWSKIGKRQPLFNLSFSNVWGSQEEILGAPIIANYPFGPVVNGVGLNITASTLNDKIGFGIISCPQLLPDIWDLADGLPLALQELLDA